MMKALVLGVAALLTAAIAAPAMAQDAPQDPGAYQRPHRWNDSNYRQGQSDDRQGQSDFWPADVAAGAVAGTVGTATAIAAAPFGAGPYAYYGGPGMRTKANCGPGTWETYRGRDGQWYPCH